MEILKDFLLTHTDIKGETSLLVHVKSGCNLHCFKCYNYKDLIENEDKNEWVDESRLFEYLDRNIVMFDSVILSGGEPTLLGPYLFAFCKIFQSKYPRIKLVLNTNGTRPKVLKYLIDNCLVDSVYLDLKFPLGEVKKEDQEVWEKVYGIKFNEKIQKSIDKSLNMLYNTDIAFYLRTPEYPFLVPLFFKRIKKDVKDLNEKHNRNISYEVNPFYLIN